MARRRRVQIDPARVETPEQRDAMDALLVSAIEATEAAWGFANKTPPYHGFTDELAAVLSSLNQMRGLA